MLPDCLGVLWGHPNRRYMGCKWEAQAEVPSALSARLGSGRFSNAECSRQIAEAKVRLSFRICLVQFACWR